MMLWLVFALMTAAAIFAVLWPLSRGAAGAGGTGLAVYRDQLDEIGRDRAAGSIGDAEAEAAKIEVSRRMIAAADADAADTAASTPSPVWGRRVAATVALLALPAAALSFYLALGSPDLPGLPLSDRLQAREANPPIETMIARVEDYLAHNPKDGRGWEVLAPVYMRVGRFNDAARALRNAIDLNGSSAMREADLGEALVAARSGMVTAEAKAAFDRALALDANEVRARFYTAMAADQDGRRAEAQAIWRDMLAKAPPGAPWIEMVRLAMVRSAPGEMTQQTSSGTAAPGPTATDIAAADSLAPDQKKEMIEGMVARLAERLKQDGSDAEGWARLVRSYVVLGQRDKARAAADDARRSLAGNADKLHRFEDAIKSLGADG
jgi:cytochrome c-type biogenesis protein CcmH